MCLPLKKLSIFICFITISLTSCTNFIILIPPKTNIEYNKAENYTNKMRRVLIIIDPDSMPYNFSKTFKTNLETLLPEQDVSAVTMTLKPGQNVDFTQSELHEYSHIMFIRVIDSLVNQTNGATFLVRLTLNVRMNDIQLGADVLSANIEINNHLSMGIDIFGKPEGIVAAQDLITLLKEEQLFK